MAHFIHWLFFHQVARIIAQCNTIPATYLGYRETPLRDKLYEPLPGVTLPLVKTGTECYLC